MPPHQPPSFSDLEYWDNRFTSTSTPFDWLLPPTTLDPLILSTLQSSPSPDEPKILHIGCGNSELSFRLGELVSRPEGVWNTDYSKVVVDQGRAIEEARWRAAVADTTLRTEASGSESKNRMNWKVLDLLDAESVAELGSVRFDVIIDKSTSDAISCGPDLPLPHRSSTLIETKDNTSQADLIHPLDVLAIHLARLTQPGSKWLSISYSADRFSFFHSSRSTIKNPSTGPSPSGNLEPTLSGYPNPADLWRLESKAEMEIPPSPPIQAQTHAHGEPENSPTKPEKRNRKKAEEPVFRPREVVWVYILRRSEVETS